MAEQMESIVLAARLEWDRTGVLAADTYINLSNAGYLPESLIESWEQDIE